MSATILSCVYKTKDEGTVQLGGSNNSAQMTVKQFYQVQVAEDTARAAEVVSASGSGSATTAGQVALPAYWQSHDIYPNLQCLTKTAKREKGSREAKNIWEVECDFALYPVTGNTPNANNIKVSVTGVKTPAYTQLSQDSNNTQIVNSVGDLVEPQEITLYDEVIAVSYETSEVNGDAIAELRGKINNGNLTFTVPQGGLYFTRSMDKHCALLDSADISTTVSVSNPNATVWTVNIVVIGRADSWDPAIPQKGYRWYDSNNALTEWKTQAQYLDNNGNLLGNGAQIVTIDPKPQLYKEADLATLLDNISMEPAAIERAKARNAEIKRKRLAMIGK